MIFYDAPFMMIVGYNWDVPKCYSHVSIAFQSWDLHDFEMVVWYGDFDGDF